MREEQVHGSVRVVGKLPALYRIFNVVYVALFAVVLLLIVFFNLGTFYAFKWYFLLLAVVVGALVPYVLVRLFSRLKTLSPLAEGIVVTALLLAFLVLQLVVGWQLRVQPSQSWDYGLVFGYAQDYVQNGTVPGSYFGGAGYFQLFPNNTGLYMLLCGFFSVLKLFGVTNFLLPSIILNAVVIDVSLLLLHRSARYMFGTRRALFLLLFSFLALPFVLYVPILYSDTITLPFAIGAVLLWLHARNHWRNGRFNKTILLFCGLSALVAVGSIVKMTVLIVWIAIVVDLLVLLRGRGRFTVLLAGLFAVAAVLLGGWYLRYTPLLPAYDKDESVPAMHWVMMGLQGNGGYNDDDYQQTLSKPDYAERYEYVAGEIGNRLAKMGVFGTVQHIGNKLSYTFGDGTFTAADKLDRSPLVPDSALHDWFIFSGAHFHWVAYFAFAYEAAMLFWGAVGALQSLLRKNPSLVFVRVALFGLTAFLMLWETRARYLINYLPLFLLAMLEGLPKMVSERERRTAREAFMRQMKSMVSPGDAGFSDDDTLIFETQQEQELTGNYSWPPMLERAEEAGYPYEEEEYAYEEDDGADDEDTEDETYGPGGYGPEDDAAMDPGFADYGYEEDGAEEYDPQDYGDYEE